MIKLLSILLILRLAKINKKILILITTSIEKNNKNKNNVIYIMRSNNNFIQITNYHHSINKK